jgi:SAM-dependent methyltransferase
VPFDRLPAVEAVLARRGGAPDYGWRLCMECGNAQPTSPPDMAVLEEVWQSNRKTPGDQAALWAHRRRIAEIGAARSWEMFSGLSSGAGRRFLDIACGHGVTVKRFQDGGWEAEGIDIDATMKPFHDELGIRTRIGPVEKETWEEPFDLIQIAYAIYFISDPRAFLQHLVRLIRPGGHLAIVMSDHLSWTQSGGPNYMHTFIPTALSLQGLLARAGYRTVLSRRIKDSWFIAATPGEAAPPALNTGAILRAHRTRAMRWRLFGAPRERLKQAVLRLKR